MDYLQGVAIRAGYSLAEFAELELDQVLTVYKIEQHKERQEWERARLGWFHTVRGYANVKKPQQLHKFHWEHTMNAEEVRRIKELVKKTRALPKHL